MKGVWLRFLGTAAALPLAAWVLPGVQASSAQLALLAGLVLAALYLVIRPIAKLIAAPIDLFSFGIVGVLVDTGLVGLTAAMFGGLRIAGFWWTVAVAGIVCLLRMVFGRIVAET